MACVRACDRASRAIGLGGATCYSGTGRFCLHLCELCRVYKRQITISWANRRYMFAHVAATKSSSAILLNAFGKFAGRTSLSLSILCSHMLCLELLLSAGLSWRAAWCRRWSRAVPHARQTKKGHVSECGSAKPQGLGRVSMPIVSPHVRCLPCAEAWLPY